MSHAPDFAYEKHVLDNGLEVVLHEDHGEPVVAVHLAYHVGSSREEPGRSGFAHLFEHMLFQGSENVPDNDHFRLIQEAGGTLNGTTNQDRTNYFETLPAERLDLALWLESDRMGFLLPAMTQAKLDNQRDVVMNERRQSYENRPYGLVLETMLGALYPDGHPYSWPTIGSMEDIAAATLDDVTRFFRRWYGPNNATLAIGGDFDPALALARVEHWFGSLPRGPEVERPVPRPAGLCETRRLVLEDRVQLPQLTLCWPTVHSGHPDEAALELLGDVLSANKSSLLDRALMIDAELASVVTIAHVAQERAGYLVLQLRPHPGVTLTRLEERVEELLAGLAADGVDAQRLERLKRKREAEVYRALETVASRTARLCLDNLFHRDPARLLVELERRRAVTAGDLESVFRRYVLGRPRVALSTVPAGKRELAAVERPAERAPAPARPARGSAPEAGEPHPFRSPPIWEDRLGPTRVLGTPFERVPLTRLSLAVSAGRAWEAPGERGLALLASEMLEEGTRALSGTEFLDELDGLGARLSVQSGVEDLVVRLSVLDEALPRAAELLTDVLLEPRLDAADFERLRRARLVDIDTRGDRIGALAEDGFMRLVFGDRHPRGAPALGERAEVEALTADDVRAFLAARVRPDGARLCVVGAHEARGFGGLFGDLATRWGAGTADGERPEASLPAPPTAPTVYLIDKPGAAQSELRVGHLAVPAGDPDYFPLQALNHVLGGAFASRLNLNLREDKGWTYGVRSSFVGGVDAGWFVAQCAVASDVTAPALGELLREVRGLLDGVKDAEADSTRESMSRALARSLESTSARLGLLETIARLDHPFDLLEQRLAWLHGMRAGDLDALARRHVRPDELVLLVVGDRAAVLEPLRGLGLGEVVELDPSGTPLARC